MLIKLFFYFVVCLWSNSYAVDFIQQQDQKRCTVYAEDRNERDAKPFTKTINQRLTNHTEIDYNRQATLEELEVIYKTMMGSVIVHEDSAEFYRKSARGGSQYNSYFKDLQVIDKSARLLWEKIQDGIYLDQLDQICKKAAHRSLLTKYFIK